jgi:hypothetical protein
VGLTLEVTVPGQRPYEVETGESVSRASMGIVVPGHVLKLKVHPTDPDQVAVDWPASLRVD